DAVGAAHDDNGLAGDLGGDEGAGLGDLRGTADQLPAPAPHGLALERLDARVGVPVRRDRRRALEGRGVVEPGQDVVECGEHSLVYPRRATCFKSTRGMA